MGVTVREKTGVTLREFPEGQKRTQLRKGIGSLFCAPKTKLRFVEVWRTFALSMLIMKNSLAFSCRC